jgi:hypothetical protein
MDAIEVCQKQSCRNLGRDLTDPPSRLPSLCTRGSVRNRLYAIDWVECGDVVAIRVRDWGSRTRTFCIEGS